MKKENQILNSIAIRYFLMIVFSLFNLGLFYLIFKPITIYGSYYLLNLFSNPLVAGNIISINGQGFEIINACVIGAAYYLLFILFMGIQKIDLKRRIFLILSSFAALYVLNISRIVFLITIFGSPHFKAIHWIFWNIISTLFIVIIFISAITIFNIIEIPFLQDLQFLYKSTKGAKKEKS